MDLPIDRRELGILVKITEKIAGDGLGKRNVDAEKLYNKLRLVKEVMDDNPDESYEKILREKHGMVI